MLTMTALFFIVKNYSKRESCALERIDSTEVDDEDRKRHEGKDIVENSRAIYCISRKRAHVNANADPHRCTGQLYVIILHMIFIHTRVWEHSGVKY